MILLLIIILTLSITLVLPLSSSPVLLGIVTFTLAATISIIISTLTSSWFGLILFIIYISGILVIFAYFITISPNQQISTKVIILRLFNRFILNFLFMSPLLKFSLILRFFNSSYTHTLSFLYFPSSFISLTFLASLLLLTLIFVVKITARSHGTLRPFS